MLAGKSVSRNLCLAVGLACGCNNAAPATPSPTAAKSAGKSTDAGSSNATGSGAVAVTGFLASSDITAPTNYPGPYSTADARNAVASDGAFYDTHASTNNCLTTLFGTIILKATDTQITAQQTLDLRSCYATLNNNANITFTYSSANMHVLVEETCSQGGLAKYNGATLAQLTSATLSQGGGVCTGGTASVLQETQIIAAGTYVASANGQTDNGSINATQISFLGQGDLSPCQTTISGGVATIGNGCENVTYYTNFVNDSGSSSNNTNSQVNFAKVSLGGVSEANDGKTTWPTSGQSNVVFDDWTGTVTYGGPTTAPTYSLTNGSGSTLTGQLPTPGSSASLRLVDGTGGVLIPSIILPKISLPVPAQSR